MMQFVDQNWNKRRGEKPLRIHLPFSQNWALTSHHDISTQPSA